MAMWGKGGVREGESILPGHKAIEDGTADGAYAVPFLSKLISSYPSLEKTWDFCDKYLGWLVTNKERKKTPKLTKPDEDEKKEGKKAGGYSLRKDYRDADTADEFGYARMRREAKRHGYNVVEMPDLRMQSTFGNIGYEKDDDIYVAMSKAGTHEGTEIIGHELMAKLAQKKTGKRDHEFFHPGIEKVQGSLARDFIKGLFTPKTVDKYTREAIDLSYAA